MALASGTTLGPYEIVASLGAGGMAEVYRAKDTRLSRDVAIKTLPPGLSKDPIARQRFEREAKTLRTLLANEAYIVFLPMGSQLLR